MPHHFPKSTVQAEAWCLTCNKNTPHYVWDGRIGRCMNEHPHPEKNPRHQNSREGCFKERKGAAKCQS